MDAVISLFGISMLLWIGQELRSRLKILQKLYIPTAVISGLVGLIAAQILPSPWTEKLFFGWSKMPGFMINLVFATLFLGSRLPGWKSVWRQGGPQLAYGQMVAWGQYMVGVGMVLFLLKPLWKTADVFGVLVEVGFEGGHGTAAGLKPTFDNLGWPAGTDFALASATVGIISAILIGIALINWAARRGHLAVRRRLEGGQLPVDPPFYSPEERPVGSWLTVPPGAVDSLALHLAVTGIAVGLGWGLYEGIGILIRTISSNPTTLKIAESFPLFPLCMLGGLLVQLLLQWTGREQWVEKESFQRIGGMSLDILVVAAITTIRLDLIASDLLPFFLLCLAGILWNVFMLIVVARRLLPTHWFERAIAEMGQSMGVTATGLLLLRAVDPKSETDAPAAFAYKQLLHEPIMGGGLWTSLAIPLVVLKGGWLVFGIATTAVLFWFFLGQVLSRKISW